MIPDSSFSYSANTIITILLILIFLLTALFIYSMRMREILSKKEVRFRLLAENAKDIIYHIQIKPVFSIEYMSPAVNSILGYSPQEFYEDADLLGRIISPDYLDLWHHLKLAPERLGSHLVVKVFAKDNREVWVEIQQINILDDKGNVRAIEGISRDITERKKTDNQLWYLSLHDSLTGLSNRVYFEDRLQNIKKEGDLPVGIVVCDIEGLKFINDTLGHNVGDMVLKSTTSLLEECYKGSDTIARIGGDEFAVILTNCDRGELEHLCGNLERLITKHNIDKPEIHISLSLGYSFGDGNEKSLYDLYRDAEDMMYRQKLKQANVARIAIVNALAKAIGEKDYTTEGHSSSLSLLLEKTACVLGLSQQNIETLKKLALFHDIGKIGIPDHILFKPGPLNSEEMTEMKKHSEIGYRIALSSPELITVADLILKHHERWDGKGYPLGLKEKDIPLECRVLAVADAFDAMTSDRPYRSAMCHESAVKELMRCSGTQFDPTVISAFMQVIQEKENILDQ